MNPSDRALPQVDVRVLGSLRPFRTDRGLPYEFSHAVPADGVVARQLVTEFGLPLDRTEGVFVNHVVHGLGVRIMPGDRIAFCPNDTPGPHRFFLGLFNAGRDDDA
ncbi:MAG: MoaD/ThiS family protein [Coriobacteriia bacterium]|nr:MoaD/ThiS family protein [Coriobacteriia bacterium]